MSYKIDSATYSTEEQVVGTWVDGKTIYRKVVTVQGSTSTTSYDTNLGVAFETLVNIRGWIVSTNNTAYEQITPFYGASDTNWRFFTRRYPGNTSLICSRITTALANAIGTFSFFYIIEYTKTTD